MKIALGIAFLSLATTTHATNPADSTGKKKFFSDFRLSFEWGEFGRCYAFKQRNTLSTTTELNMYLNSAKSGGDFGAFGTTLYFRKFGLGVMFRYYDLSSKSSGYNDYLSSNYSNYFTPDKGISYNVELMCGMVRACYRQAYRYFYLEPELKVGINSYTGSNYLFRMKEIGSNQYVQLHLHEDLQKVKNSYHLSVRAGHTFNLFTSRHGVAFDAGVRAEFFVVPIRGTYTIEETHYGQETEVTQVDFNRWNPGISFGGFVNIHPIWK